VNPPCYTKNFNKEVEDDLISENQRLRMENKFLKKLKMKYCRYFVNIKDVMGVVESH